MTLRRRDALLSTIRAPEYVTSEMTINTSVVVGPITPATAAPPLAVKPAIDESPSARRAAVVMTGARSVWERSRARRHPLPRDAGDP